jgi:hypothetical protein
MIDHTVKKLSFTRNALDRFSMQTIGRNKMTHLNIKQLPEKYREIVNKQLKPQNTSKYHAKKIEIDGYKFDSIKEGNRYQELKLLQKTGEINFFIRQPMLDLEGGAVYKADFLIFWKDGSYSIEDVKGFYTEIFKLKRTLIEAKYPFKISIK